MIVDQLQRFSKDVSFDAMKDIAPVLPVGAISHLVGIPDEGRERMLEWAAAAFNAIGPTPDADDAALLREAFRSEEHTSELQSLLRLSYPVFFLKKHQHLHITT